MEDELRTLALAGRSSVKQQDIQLPVTPGHTVQCSGMGQPTVPCHAMRLGQAGHMKTGEHREVTADQRAKLPHKARGDCNVLVHLCRQLVMREKAS
ncbi:hypothetical protein ElyMa_001373000 [Elysia marginata]|uniref:Uncharacterized protein n=1 Tax=Elysia marginata TaxID=1093978 RepID=A0AAV4IRT3_9GAST|nr:hypothetical protein ElyMa_001373000 [Elysia marginata]